MVNKTILELGRTFSEFSLLPGLTRKDCAIPYINLGTRLGNVNLRNPLLSAAMTSVTGYELALSLGREGGMGVLPARLSVEDQSLIVRRIKNLEMNFVENPLTINADATIEEALRLVEKHGHSKIPIIDRNNVYRGLFIHPHYLESNATPSDMVTSVAVYGEPVCSPELKIDDAKSLMNTKGMEHIVVLDKEKRLVKMAFRKDFERINVGAAIYTHSGWETRVEANIKAGVDMIVIDTSDAFSEFARDVVVEYKKNKKFRNLSLCAGNIVTYEGAMCLMKAGADVIKVGMSSGSICTTKREKAVGRAPMTALMEVSRARNDFSAKIGRYVPIIMDGGIASPADMVIALTIADAIMMGGYFNKFFEALGGKLDEAYKLTNDESRMRYVETWGEGSLRAQSLYRYGQSKRTFFPEGEEGTVVYAGRLKPGLKIDLIKIRAALCNAGCMNLEELRKNAVIELNSLVSNQILASTHNIAPRA